jgi:hypothetical protein
VNLELEKVEIIDQTNGEVHNNLQDMSLEESVRCNN